LQTPPRQRNALSAYFSLEHLSSRDVSFLELQQVPETQFPSSVIQNQFSYHAYKLKPLGDQATGNARDEMLRDLAKGIDFSQPELPPYIDAIAGISHGETTGRWTVGRVAQLKFEHPLPARFALELE